jgi:ubiquitin C-terminal hydrolase
LTFTEKEEPNSSASEAYRHKLEEALKNGITLREFVVMVVGPYVYELYAILVHRGTSMGGHYYAYIKVFAALDVVFTSKALQFWEMALL